MIQNVTVYTEIVNNSQVDRLKTIIKALPEIFWLFRKNLIQPGSQELFSTAHNFPKLVQIYYVYGYFYNFKQIFFFVFTKF